MNRPITAHKLKLGLARALTHPLIGRTITRLGGGTVPTKYGRFMAPASVVSPNVAASLFWGLYERNEVRFIRRHLSGHYDVVELGSSLGLVSCVSARQLSKGRRIVCVEANPDLLDVLSANLARNCACAYRIEHGAINYGGGHEVVLNRGPSNLSGSVTDNTETSQRGVSVPAFTLKDVVERAGLGEFALVSDIEGAEAAMLRDDAEVLGRCREAVLELHDTTLDGQRVSVDDLIELLLAQGFTLLERHGPVVAVRRP